MAGVIDTEIIDLITYDEINDAIKFIMIEEREWDDSPHMLEQLQDKVNNYLVYIEDGQMFEDYPDYKNKKIIIQLDVSSNPEGTSKLVINNLEKALLSRGIGFHLNLMKIN